MGLSPYFTDDELEYQLRQQFDKQEQWDINFKMFFNNIEDLGTCFFLRIRGREFFIDKVTGAVSELNSNEE